MVEPLFDQVEKILLSLNIEPQREAVGNLVTYIAEIELWNPKYKLVAVKDRQELLVRHIADSLAPMSIIDAEFKRFEHGKAADVGSGNGMPGIPLAIMNRDLHISLIERSGRRAGFLRNVITLCGLSERVEVVERDLSEVHQCFDLLMFRAFRPLQDVISELDRILAEGGSMCAFKSRKSSVDAELKAVEHVAAGRYHFTQVPYHLPGSEAERRIVRIQRAS